MATVECASREKSNRRDRRGSAIHESVFFAVATDFADAIIAFSECFAVVQSGGIAQLVERLVRNEKARGSNPLTSMICFVSCRCRSN